MMISSAFLTCVLAFCGPPEEATNGVKHPRFIYVDRQDVQTVIDGAPPHSIVMCDRNRQITLSTPIRIQKPLTLKGLNARLPEKLGHTSLVVVEAEGVTVSDFELRGNIDSVPQQERAALLVVGANNFRVENGRFIDSSKDGVIVNGPLKQDEDLTGGVIRDIVGFNIGRDLVSLGGGGRHGQRIRNVLVDNVRCYGSPYRGAVEVSDGTDNITVRKVYAENCVYAIDVQDHGEPQQINSNIVIQDVYAKNCDVAIRTANRPHGHSNLTLRDVTANRCSAALTLRNTNQLTVQNVRVIDNRGGNAISIRNCDGVNLRDVFVTSTTQEGAAQQEIILLEDCNDLLMDGLMLRGNTEALSSAIRYRINSDEAFSGLCIRNVSVLQGNKAGIVLDNASDRGTLTNYIISGNMARVQDEIQGQHAIIINNGQEPE